MPDSRMGQQLLPVPPQQLLPHLRLELDLYRLSLSQRWGVTYSYSIAPLFAANLGPLLAELRALLA